MRRGTVRGKGVTLGGVLVQLLPWVVWSGLFAAVGVMHVSARVLVVDAGYRLSRLEAEGRELARENDALKVELATLRSPGRLERLAREKLSMAPPPSGAVITLRESQVRLGRTRARSGAEDPALLARQVGSTRH